MPPQGFHMHVIPVELAITAEVTSRRHPLQTDNADSDIWVIGLVSMSYKHIKQRLREETPECDAAAGYPNWEMQHWSIKE
jgi:hypothetical protein